MDTQKFDRKYACKNNDQKQKYSNLNKQIFQPQHTERILSSIKSQHNPLSLIPIKQI
jgi:predicted outer membrane protein